MSPASTVTSVSTTDAPAALGPYSQAVKANGFVFVSASGPLVASTGALVEGGVGAQTKQMLENVKAILAASGSSVSQIVKTTVFLLDMSDFAAMNAAYDEYFNENAGPSLENPRPARSTIQITAMPKAGMLVGMDCTATY